MKRKTFEDMKEIIDISEYKPKKVGEVFLYGSNLIQQKINKTEGQEVSYFVVTELKKNGDFTYRQVFDKLD